MSVTARAEARWQQESSCRPCPLREHLLHWGPNSTLLPFPHWVPHAATSVYTVSWIYKPSMCSSTLNLRSNVTLSQQFQYNKWELNSVFSCPGTCFIGSPSRSVETHFLGPPPLLSHCCPSFPVPDASSFCSHLLQWPGREFSEGVRTRCSLETL